MALYLSSAAAEGEITPGMIIFVLGTLLIAGISRMALSFFNKKKDKSE